MIYNKTKVKRRAKESSERLKEKEQQERIRNNEN